MSSFTRIFKGLALSILASGMIQAQTNQAPHKCSTMEVLEQEILANPEVRQQQEQFRAQLNEYLLKNKGQAKAGEKRIIPVVFHVIHECGPENISREQVLDQIRILNEDFSRLNSQIGIIPSDFAAVAADCEIEFRLATKDDNGNCTDGIVRVYSPKTNEANNANGVKAVSFWNSYKYLNIWVVKSIGTVQGTGGEVLGYAQFPLGGAMSTDGIVVRHDCIGSIGTAQGGAFGVRLGRTATHEIGHWLGLRHIWGDADCGSDGVDDTPIAAAPNYGICWSDYPYNVGGCAGGDTTNGEMFMNYMDYSDDQCMGMFTIGQKEIMDATLSSIRANLHSDGNLSATGTTDADVLNPTLCNPIASFCENRDMVCDGGTITYTDASYNALGYTRSWEFEGGSPSTSTSASPAVSYANPGTYKVKLTVSNSAGENMLEKTDYVTISTDQATLAQGPFWDNMDSQDNFLQNYRTVNGDNSANKWEWAPWVGFGPYNSCVRMRNFNNTPTEIDAFITPSYDISTVPSPSMTFRISAAERGGEPNDQLRVFTSTNCGQSWVLRKSWSGEDLITAGYYSSEFTPTDMSQWVDFAVSLSGVSSQTNVRFKIEFVAGEVGSNNLYLDDIRIGTGLGTNDLLGDVSISLFPNPASDVVGLEFNISKPSDVKVSMVDMLGKQVSTPFSGKADLGVQSFNLDLSHITSGVYMVQVTIDGYTFTKKLVKK